MSWIASLPEPQRQTAQRWLAHVLHDLVKYLELMPRSLDWNNLEEDDFDVLYEAICETRVDRHGVRSARMIWEQALADLPEDLRREIPGRQQLDDLISVLDTNGQRLAAGDTEGLNVERLREVLFGIGDMLRDLRP